LQQRHKHAVRDFGYDITKGVEPVWDSETGKLHYEHYLSLVNRLNRALTNTEHEDLNASQVLLRVSDRHPLHDLAAEIVNHETMWSSVCPGGKPPSERMKQILNIQFGGLQNFISQWIGVGSFIYCHLFS
jgi:superoxide dismutase